MNSASVGPSEFEHVVQVVGDAEEFFLAVVGGGDGVHQEMRLGCGADDGTVAVGPIAQHRTRDVRAVAVEVFCVVPARAQTKEAARRCSGWEREDAGDVVAEIRVHVGVVDAVVKTGVGHRHDDTLTAQAGPRSIDVRHVRAVPGVVDVHHLNPTEFSSSNTGRGSTHSTVSWARASQPLDTDGHGGKAAAVGIEHDVGAVFKAFWKRLSGEHDVDQRSPPR